MNRMPLQVLVSYCVTLFLVLSVIPTVVAHVPYLEEDDLTEANPFVVENPVQSIAVYGYLESEDDVDVFELEITESPTLLYADIKVPVCGDLYESFSPSMVIVGPGLPKADFPVPIDVPVGQGAIFLTGGSGADREIYDEFFGNKKYYRGPVFETNVNDTGTYKLAVYDPNQKEVGDYLLALGKEEIWRAGDIFRALILTPLIRWGSVEVEAEDCEKVFPV
jgi:hypothetical protein